MYLQNDFVDNFINRLILRGYEKEKAKAREKKAHLSTTKHIIVKVNEDIIFDSKANGEISEPLLIALKSYESELNRAMLMQKALLQPRRHKRKNAIYYKPIDVQTYNIQPSVTSLFPSEQLEQACISSLGSIMASR